MLENPSLNRIIGLEKSSVDQWEIFATRIASFPDWRTKGAAKEHQRRESGEVELHLAL